MRIWPFNKVADKLIGWLMYEHAPAEHAVCDFDRISYELKPCDVILVEGRSRVSEVIKVTTRSNWSHSAIYIGRINDIKDDKLRARVKKHYQGKLSSQLIIEGILGKGIIVSPLSDYKQDHVRICRPSGIASEDADKVIEYCINELGNEYNVRSIFDILRWLFPITFMPRYLFSSLMNPIKARKEHKDICSTLLSKAFASVKYPLLPHLHRDKKGKIELVPRNPALFTPKDFDYSPYFEIIKYPLFGFAGNASYQNFPWNEEGMVSNDEAGIFVPDGEGGGHEIKEDEQVLPKNKNKKQDTDDEKT